MIRYAVKRIDTGEWREARYSKSFGGWDEAQLWENAKAAQREVKEWKKNWKWVNSVETPDPVECIVVAVNIAEPK